MVFRTTSYVSRRPQDARAECPLLATSGLSGHVRFTSALPPRADVRVPMSGFVPISSALGRQMGRSARGAGGRVIPYMPLSLCPRHGNGALNFRTEAFVGRPGDRGWGPPRIRKPLPLAGFSGHLEPEHPGAR